MLAKERLKRGPLPRLCFDGRIAQLVEQLTLNQRVLGSSPSAPTIKTKNSPINIMALMLRSADEGPFVF